MKMTVKNITIRLVAFIMIGMIGMLIANKAIFLHSHRLSNGTVIEHAHPYNKTNDSEPYKSHQHTKAELLFFQNLGILFLLVIVTFALLNLVRKAKKTFFRISEYSQCCIIHYKGRAPPIS